MDLSESTRLLLNRISEFDPGIASKVIGYLLLKDHGDSDMIRLTYGPDSGIQALIEEVRSALPYIKLSTSSSPVTVTAAASATETIAPNHHQHLQNQSRMHISPHPVLSPSSATNHPVALQFQPQHQQFWDTDAVMPVHQYTPRSTLDPHAPYGIQHHPNLISVEELNYADFVNDATVLGPRTTRRSSYIIPAAAVAAEPPPSPKACHYYYKGYCKHGHNCRYLHDQPQPIVDAYTLSSADLADDQDFVPGSVEKLEAEIADLIRSRRGQPISIAALPSLYAEKYGRGLQAQGYLTESQRHGKAGYNLTKLLARMKSTIRLIDRPHGQHSVILAEDAPRSFEYTRAERNESVNTVSSSQQIYLTFPADSTFTEDDIATYFSHFGAVQAVRIPAQQKRMFGFVTFAHPDAVLQVFAKGNPHYICDARVLVKPYREKTRKSCDKIEIPIYYHPPYMDLSPEFQPVPKAVEAQLFRKQLEQEHLMELQRHMNQLRLASQPYALLPCVGYNMPTIGYQEELNQTPLAEEEFSRGIVDVTDESVDGEDMPSNTNVTCCDKTSQVDLPESPFASL